MNSIYLAIWYKCNQTCKGCPCCQNVDRSKNMSLNDIKKACEAAFDSYGERFSITVSGGEPTLHPQFFEIMRYFKERNFFVTILTNAEKFDNNEFCNRFLENVSIQRTRIVTTLHSSDPAVHEQQNGTPNSFKKSVNGLLYLFHHGIGVTIKHCITGVNYNDTVNFIKFVDETFHPFVDIQLFGIDYCGLTKEQACELYKPYSQMQPYIEAGLDECIALLGKNGRRTTVFNYPLCAVDPFYWKLFVLKKNDSYGMYFDPTNKLLNFSDGAGTYSTECEMCYVRDICSGTYKSTFDYFGNDVVRHVTEYDNGND